jgi:hypothetical protein
MEWWKVKETTMDLAVWRDVSLLWLILLTGIAVLPIGIILFFVVKALHRLRQLTKRAMPVAQKGARLMADKTDKLSQKIADPFIEAHVRGAQINGFVKAISTRRERI